MVADVGHELLQPLRQRPVGEAGYRVDDTELADVDVLVTPLDQTVGEGEQKITRPQLERRDLPVSLPGAERRAAGRPQLVDGPFARRTTGGG